MGFGLNFGFQKERPSDPVKAAQGQKTAQTIAALLRRFKGRLWRATELPKK